MNRSQYTNLRFVINEYHIDAAIDINWTLHSYPESEEFKNNHTAIELYNFDRPEWDVHVIYQEQRNQYQIDKIIKDKYCVHAVVDIENLIQEIKSWIEINENN